MGVTSAGFSPKLTVCLALSREVGAPTSAPACCSPGAFAKLRPALGSTALAVPSDLPFHQSRRAGGVGWPSGPASITGRTQASPACQVLAQNTCRPLSSSLASGVQHSNQSSTLTYIHMFSHVYTHSTILTSLEQSPHTPVIGHIAFLLLSKTY